MSYKSFLVTISDHIATVSFNRPDKANSLDIDAWKEMQNVFNDLAINPEARVIILRGEGKHFCAGMDLNTLMSVNNNFEGTCPARKRDALRKFIKLIQATITAIEDCRKPVIAAIHKACVGGGINIVTACDIRYCTDDAFFSIKETDLGLVADIGVLQRLPKIINASIANELAYTGRQFDGQEAKRIMLVGDSFSSYEELLNHVNQLAAEIASKSPLVVQGTKEVLLYTRDHSVEASLDFVANWNASMLISNDITEAMTAYMQKRKAIFKDS